MIYEQVKISPMRGFRFKMLEDFRYKDVLVPKGYITNGADVPRIFWSFFPPYRSDYFPAVILHDYLCDQEKYKKADDYFEQMMRDIKMSELTIFVMSSAVRVYHWWKYGTALLH